MRVKKVPVLTIRSISYTHFIFLGLRGVKCFWDFGVLGILNIDLDLLRFKTNCFTFSARISGEINCGQQVVGMDSRYGQGEKGRCVLRRQVIGDGSGCRYRVDVPVARSSGGRPVCSSMRYPWRLSVVSSRAASDGFGDSMLMRM